MSSEQNTPLPPFGLGRPARGVREQSIESEDRSPLPGRTRDAAGGLEPGAFTRESKAAQHLVGRPPRGIDRRKFKYDVYAGKANPLMFAVSRDDRMSAEEAGEKLTRIHELMGVESADPSILYAFDMGLWFCHTVNGGSTLNPGRSFWSVPSHTERFDYAVVRNYLGVDLRRFFRAYADDILLANKQVMDAYDPSKIGTVEHFGWLMEVAAERGLTRFPYLAHDSADACTELNASERQALMNSKKMVIGSVVNTADRMRNTSRVQSADGFDSTAGEYVGR